jgi:hypothetical protein
MKKQIAMSDEIYAQNDNDITHVGRHQKGSPHLHTYFTIKWEACYGLPYFSMDNVHLVHNTHTNIFVTPDDV